MDSVFNSKIGKTSGNPVDNDNAIASCVAHLFTSCLPLAVSGFIIAVVILSSQCQSFWSFTHVSQEVFKSGPTLAYRYIPFEIIVSRNMVWVARSLVHCNPKPVSSTRAKPVCSGLLAPSVTVKTPARFGVSALKAVIENSRLFSAITETVNSTFEPPSDGSVGWCFRDNFQSSKAFTDERYFSGHNDGHFIVVSSGDSRVQPTSPRYFGNVYRLVQTKSGVAT
jgi:hypothetical protein